MKITNETQTKRTGTLDDFREADVKPRSDSTGKTVSRQKPKAAPVAKTKAQPSRTFRTGTLDDWRGGKVEKTVKPRSDAQTKSNAQREQSKVTRKQPTRPTRSTR